MCYKHTILAVIAVLVIFAAVGCTNIGPGTIGRDRFNYVDAIGDSWKRQTLLNTVKIRYADAPVFVDVSSIVSQYSLVTQVNGSLSWDALLPGNSQSIGGSSIYADRPTITYQPLRGEKFTRSLMTPVSPVAVMSLIQSRSGAQMVLRICAQSINGMNNRSAGRVSVNPGDRDFYKLTESLRKIQQSMAWGMRIEDTDDKEKATVTFFGKKDVDEDIATEIASAKELLGLDPNSHEYEVVYGEFARNDKEIAILTRSMLGILSELASYIDVPEEHLAEGRAFAVFEKDTEAAFGVEPLIRIHSGRDRPDDAFVAVKYRDYWFWVDDRDVRSKRMFSFLMFLFTLAETGMPEQAPVLTIPTR